MKTIKVYRAQDLGRVRVRPVLIRIDEPVPNMPSSGNLRADMARHDRLLDAQAKTIATALLRHLPGGTYDRVLAHMQANAAEQSFLVLPKSKRGGR